MIIKSPAKINLSLKVKDKRPDGYHELEMVEIPLELHDVLEFEALPHSPDPYITCDDVGIISIKNNLCKKALDAMRAHFKFTENFAINVHKDIPFAAGLGGGSSNAAAVMLGIKALLKLKTTPEEMNQIGLSLGADVPFFLQTHPCLVGGIGEVLTPIKIAKAYECLIVKPLAGLSTTQVFAIADSCQRRAIDTGKVVEALATGDDVLLAKSLGNDLMAPAERLLPDVGEVYDLLRKEGFSIVSMSGSGSSLFALSMDGRKCREAARKFYRLGYTVRLTKIVNK